ncbi:hypothetical protein ACLKA7_009718 [Drosophila subpalustris]
MFLTANTQSAGPTKDPTSETLRTLAGHATRYTRLGSVELLLFHCLGQQRRLSKSSSAAAVDDDNDDDDDDGDDNDGNLKQSHSQDCNIIYQLHERGKWAVPGAYLPCADLTLAKQ